MATTVLLHLADPIAGTELAWTLGHPSDLVRDWIVEQFPAFPDIDRIAETLTAALVRNTRACTVAPGGLDLPGHSSDGLEALDYLCLSAKVVID